MIDDGCCSGLNHGLVQRLRSTWERVPHKHKRAMEVHHLNLYSYLYSNVCCGLCTLAVSDAKVWYGKLGESSSQAVLTYNGKHVYADTCAFEIYA